MTAVPALEAVDVTRTYELEGVVVEALRGVSLAVEPGEYAAVIGPSGSGKSTLMHLFGCLDRPTVGILRVDGRDVTSLDDTELAELRNAAIGFVFQSFQLLLAHQRRRQRVAPAGLPRRRTPGAPSAGDRGARGGRAGPPAHSPPRPAVRWRAAACGDRARPRGRSAPAAGRRTHRQPRHRERRRGHGHPRAAQHRAGGRRRARDPRRRHRRSRPTSDPHARRPHRVGHLSTAGAT